MRSIEAFLIQAVSLTCALGCADARGAFEDFEERARKIDAGAAVADGGPCEPPPPDSVSGKALIAVGTSISPGRPILFYGDVTTPEVGGLTNVAFSYHPLDATDRMTPVGDLLKLGPFPIETDGSFFASTGETELPGEANALLPGVPITSALTFEASICGVRTFYCGITGGHATAPVEGPIEGEFGLSLISGALPERPRYGCSEDAIALPLGE